MIGIVGGGQLGRMLTEAALKLGFRVTVVDPNETCPAAQAGAEQIKAAFYDAAAIRQLASRSDYLTVESEHVNTDVLQALAEKGKPVNPAPGTVALIQDKLAQKQFLEARRIAIAPFAPFKDQSSAAALLKNWGTIYVKTIRGGFDGRGNALIKDAEDLEALLSASAGQASYAEQAVTIKKELSVMVARDKRGRMSTYPVTETIHQRSICLETLTPAGISAQVAETARQTALKVVEQLDGAGVFGIEMFLTPDDQILVNEIAPRVHNSGHYTIEACRTSQFEQHIRAITGLALGSTEMIVPAAVMINILGERDGPTRPAGLDKAAAYPHTYVHMYGKSPTKVDRKMGHLTVTGRSVSEARSIAEKARATITI